MKLNPIRKYYDALLHALGPSGWWPGETPFEVAVGAILTQNTNWGNVEKAIAALRAARALSPEAMRRLTPEALAGLIRPAGYFRVKAARLGHFLDFLAAEAGDALDDLALGYLGRQELPRLREKLLAVRGIGPETADSILLYALAKPSFVIDAYTARLAQRHGLAPEETNYHDLQDIFTSALPEDVALYNECHALIVRAGKEFCKKSRPRCGDCPLGAFLEGAA